MRLICTITDKERINPHQFSYYLSSQGIGNTCEEFLENENVLYRLWVYDEDLVDKALEYYRAYQENPDDPRYVSAHSNKPIQASLFQQEADQEIDLGKTRRRFLSSAPYGPISICILLAAISLYIFAQIQRQPSFSPKISGIIQAPNLSTLEKALIYDYPYYFILRDELFKEYTAQDIEEKKSPSGEAQKIFYALKTTPVWMGLYDQLLDHFHPSQKPSNLRGPLFEKIRQGEIWRLFTPAVLHVDLLHIFFNLLWFILLGNQIEFRLGSWRYLIFILVTGILSNTAQYIATGPFFMGLSGVVVGMAAFIWARQQLAPWEGYLLHRFTLIFLGIFVIGMFFLQIGLFILQLYGTLGNAMSIANTAHLIGALTGYLLGRSSLFSIRQKLK